MQPPPAPLATAKRHRLGKDAQAAVNAQRRERHKAYTNGLVKAMEHIDETAAELAGSHNKSYRKVETDLRMARRLKTHTRTNAWNAFCWKKRQEDKENNCESSLSNSSECCTYLIFARLK